MDSREFQNALRIMFSLDRRELVEAGVLVNADDGDFKSVEYWRGLRDHPFEASIRMDEGRFAKLFDLIQSRQPARGESR